MSNLLASNSVWLTILWQSTAWLVAGLIASFLLSRQPARAHAALVVALLALLATPLASLAVAGLGCGLLSPTAAQLHDAPTPILAGPDRGGNAIAANLDAVASQDESNNPTDEPLATHAPTGAYRLSWSNLSAGLWFAWGLLSSVLAVRLAVATCRARLLLARIDPITDAYLVRRHAEAAASLGFDRPPPLGAADVRSPAVWCWGRQPIVLVPRNASENMPDVDWVGIFRHELAHWQRGDHLAEMLARVVTVLLPWHPLAWWTQRRLHEMSEQVCDQWAVAGDRSPLDYAESLVQLQPEGRRRLVLAAVTSRKLLVARVERLLRMETANPRIGTTWLAAAAVVGLLAVSALALAQTPGKAERVDVAEQMTVVGTVKLPSGEPAPGARVAVIGRMKRPALGGDLASSDPEVLGQTTADPSGRFELKVARTSSANAFNLFVLAAHPQHAVSWQRLDSNRERPQAEVLLREPRPLRGRLIDSQGKPAAEVSLGVEWLGRVVNGEHEGVHFWNPPRDLPLWPAAVKTDQEGRFVVAEVDRDLGVALQVRDPRFARDVFYISIDDKTPPDEKEYEFKVTPSQIVAGVATDADTGKPIPRARITVYASQSEFGGGTGIEGRADDQGRFELNPFAGTHFEVTAYAPEGQPYLSLRKLIAWPKEAKRQQVDLALPRGVLVRGKLTEADGGRAVAGAGIHYLPRSNNPNVAEEMVSGWSNAAISGADGTFEMAVPPGHGTLLIKGSNSDYIHQDIGEGTISRGKSGGTRLYPDALVPLDLPKEATTHDVAAVLRRGVTIRGRLVGPGGEAVTRAMMISKLQLPPQEFCWRFGEEIIDGRFELHGCDPKAEHQVMFLDSEHEWGVTVMLAGSAAAESQLIRLQPCGTATARFVDEKNKPLVKSQQSPMLIVTPGASQLDRQAYKEGKLIADQTFVSNLDRQHYWTGPLTDDDGRVRFPALIPGATYRVESGRDGKLHEWVAKSGENLALPEIQVEMD